jgi:putative sporulation protein YtaF
MVTGLIGAAIIAAAVSTDAFVSGFAYGSGRIKIPLPSVLIISMVCAFTLGVSMLLAVSLKHYIPEGLTSILSFSILFLLGTIKILDCFAKSYIRKNSDINKEFSFSLFNFKFILRLCADPVAADKDSSKVLSPSEAAPLALALSLDGFAVGFGAAFSDLSVLYVVSFTLVMTIAAVVVGGFLGNGIARNIKINISWIGGLLLIGLAFWGLI